MPNVKAHMIATEVLSVFAESRMHPQDCFEALQVAQDMLKRIAATMPIEVQRECEFLKNNRAIGFTK